MRLEQSVDGLRVHGAYAKAARVDQCAAWLVARRPPRAAAPAPPRRLVARGRNSLVFIDSAGVLAFEARDVSLAVLEEQFGMAVLRVHRNWLVALASVRELRGAGSGEATALLTGNIEVPISRDRVARVREALVAGALGLRRACSYVRERARGRPGERGGNLPPDAVS